MNILRKVMEKVVDYNFDAILYDYYPDADGVISDDYDELIILHGLE